MQKRKSENGSEKPKQYSDPEGSPDFDDLALHYTDFAKYVVHGKRGSTIDWRNTEAVKCLTRAILFTRYELLLELPPDQLCPTVTLRSNYIRFLQDLISAETSIKDGKILGLDVGTGASCIYPMLGVRMNPKWKFVGTDISKTSLFYAQKNIDNNKLSDSIELRFQTDPEQVFKGVLKDVDEQFSFTMCNPPFFSDISEACQNPNGTCTASDHEAVTDGGEEGFVEKMIMESIEFPNKVVWWTSMLGRKKSLKPLIKALKKVHLHPKIVTAELIQGKTTRWVLAWSFKESFSSFTLPPLQKRTKVLSSPVTVFSSPLSLDYSTVCKIVDGWSKERNFICDHSPPNDTILCTLDVDDSKINTEFVIPKANNKTLIMRVVASPEEGDPNKLLELHSKCITSALCDLSKMLRTNKCD